MTSLVLHSNLPWKDARAAYHHSNMIEIIIIKKLWHLFMCIHLSFSCAHRYIFLLFILFISWHSECYQSAMLFIFVLDSSLFLYYFFHRAFFFIEPRLTARLSFIDDSLCRRRLIRRNRFFYLLNIRSCTL